MTSPKRVQLLAAVLVAVAAGASALYITRPQVPLSTVSPPRITDPLSSAEIQTILEPDAIRAVDHPSFVDGDKAGARGDLAVIGVELGGEAHAFPIAYLSRVEIVNDRLGGRYIAVTW